MSEDPSTEWRRLGERLRQAREYLSLSQQDVAANTGIPRSAISDIERGQRKVDSLELRKLAKVYRVPVSTLLDNDADDDAGQNVSALARAVEGLTDTDRNEVVRFAEFLRFQSRSNTKADTDAGSGSTS